MAQDSSLPEFWETRYRSGTTPWDAGRVPPALDSWLAGTRAALRVLIPGCGSAYEAAAFARHGHDVLAVDVSDAAIEAARRRLGALAPTVKKADFFELDVGTFDLVYERAFLCALPRRLWSRWAVRAAELVKPGGALLGFFFFADNERGPPFGVSRERLHELLETCFELAEDFAVPPLQSIPVFKGKERWQLWRRRS